MNLPEDRHWTVEEVAYFLQRDEGTIRRWARRGKLQGVKLDTEWRFEPAAVRAMLRPAVLTGAAAIVEAQMNASFARVMSKRGGA